MKSLLKPYLVCLAITVMIVNYGCKKTDISATDTGYTSFKMYDDTLASILNSSINIASGNGRIYMTYGKGNSGGIVLVGPTFYFPTGHYANLMAVDNAGNLIWKKELSKEVTIQDLLVLDDGSCMAAGVKSAYIHLFRYDVNGKNILTDSIQLNVPGGANGYSTVNLKQLANGNLLIYGTYSLNVVGNGNTIGFASEYDLNLNQVWAKKYFINSLKTTINSCALTSDGGFLFAGDIKDNSTSIGSIILLKTNSTGVTIWTKKFSNQLNPKCNDLVNTDNGNYMLSFYTEANNKKQTFVYKVNASGDSLAATTINFSAQLHNPVMLSQPDGGVFALMNSLSFPVFDSNYPFLNINSSSVSLDASLNLKTSSFFQTQTSDFYIDACKTSEGKTALSGLVKVANRNYYKPALLILK